MRVAALLRFGVYLLVLLHPPSILPAAGPVFGDVLAAIVKVRAHIPPDARTAASLGLEREGSGAFIDSDGLVVTIGYLIMEAAAVEIDLSDGRTLPARVIAYDHDSGFGLLRAEGSFEHQSLRLGDSSVLGASDPVLVASYGGHAKVQPVRVVSRRLFAGYWEYLLEDAIFTAPPHQEFGGAALLNEDGALVGIGSLVVSDSVAQEFSPGNMFVPTERLSPILADLIAKGRAPGPAHPWLGLYCQEVAGRLQVRRVAADSPAAQADVRSGDVILAVGGEAIDSLASFYQAVWARGSAGIQVPITLLRAPEITEVVLSSIDRHTWLRLGTLGPK